MGNAHEDILIAVMGTTPAVLTETIWALAHENPPTFPARIYVITTRRGRQSLDELLFAIGNWDRLRQRICTKFPPAQGRLDFGPAQDCIRLLPYPKGERDLDDILNKPHSAAAGDCIMRVVREFTDDSNKRIIASVAGGRKTMGVLLASCMMLLGRRQDRLCHVLVHPPYDSPRLEPLFFFPEKEVVHRLDGERYPSEKARIELVDIPFVRMRGWYERDYRQSPPSYMTLVDRMQDMLPAPANYPLIVADLTRGTVKVGHEALGLSPTEFAVFSAILRITEEGKPLRTWDGVLDAVRALHHKRSIPPEAAWHHDFVESNFELEKDDDVRKTAGRIRNKLSRVVAPPELAYLVIPDLRKKSGQTYPAKKIRIKGVY